MDNEKTGSGQEQNEFRGAAEYAALGDQDPSAGSARIEDVEQARIWAEAENPHREAAREVQESISLHDSQEERRAEDNLRILDAVDNPTKQAVEVVTTTYGVQNFVNLLLPGMGRLTRRLRDRQRERLVAYRQEHLRAAEEAAEQASRQYENNAEKPTNEGT